MKNKLEENILWPDIVSWNTVISARAKYAGPAAAGARAQELILTGARV